MGAEKFTHVITGAPLSEINIPVIGGHAGATILAVLSQNVHSAKIPQSQIPDLDKRIQDTGTEVVTAKNGKGSATLSMGYAGARLGRAVLAGLAGTPTEACAYVQSGITKCPYFASKVTFGRTGVEKVHEVGPLNAYEQGRLNALLPALQEEVDAGLDYAKVNEFAN